MDDATVLTAAVAAMGVVILLPGWVVDAVRGVRRVVAGGVRATRMPLGLASLLAALAVTRPGPAAAATPPPSVRLAADTEGPTPLPDGGAAKALLMGTTYVVVPGDSLWAIACRSLRAEGIEPTDAQVGRFWRVIYAANRDVVGPDPDLIFPGQRLTIPRSA